MNDNGTVPAQHRFLVRLNSRDVGTVVWRILLFGLLWIIYHEAAKISYHTYVLQDDLMEQRVHEELYGETLTPEIRRLESLRSP